MGTYYKNAEPWLDRIDRAAWVELGVDRGEGSTRWFSDMAKTRATKFYGVDMDPDQIERAKVNLAQSRTATIRSDGSIDMAPGEIDPHIEMIADKGEEFLRKMDPEEQISLCYLDNFDWDYWLGQEEESFVAEVKQRYRDTIQIEMTNTNSQLTHLIQTMRLIPRLTPNSLVICDDTWFIPEEGIFSGKCSAAIPLLILHGFKLLHREGYRQNSGAILGRFRD
jgi:hypothetical protein